MKLAISFFLNLLAVIFFTTQCTPRSKNAMTSSTELQKNPSKAVVIAVPKKNLNLDPHSLEDLYSMFATLQVHRSLFRYQPDGTLKNDLVETWDVSDDRKIYSFRLANYSFSDGTPITASHVEQSLKRLFFKKASISSDMSYILNSEKKDISQLAVKALDDKNFEIRLKKPTKFLITHLALMDSSILKLSKFDEEYDITSLTALSGHYQIVKFEEKALHLKSRKLGNPKAPADVVIRTVPIEDAAKLAIAGELDSVDVYPLDVATIQQLQVMGWITHSTSLVAENFLIANPAKLKRKTREFLFQSVDISKTLEKLKGSFFSEAFGMIPPLLPGFLKEKSWSDWVGTQGDVGTIQENVELDYSASSQVSKLIAEDLQNQWKSKGLQVKLNALDLEVYFDHLFSKKSALILAVKGMDYPDGYSNLAYFVSDVPANYFPVENSSLDVQLKELPYELDDDKRIKKYENLQRELLKQMTFRPLLFGNAYSGMWSGVFAKVPEHPMGLQFLALDELEVR